MPWVGVIDEKGKAQKIPTRGGWQRTLPGQWHVPDEYYDPTMPDDDPEAFGDIKYRTRPGRGKWKPDWEEGWVCNQRTGLWVVDVDALGAFWHRMEILGIAPPRTRAQSTGRPDGGMHLLYDGRDLPEKYWKQGGLGDPVWGDLKANGYVASEGAHHPFGPVYSWLPDSPVEIVKPSLEFAEAILAERALWKATLKDQGKGGGTPTGQRNVPSMTGENRNVRLCALRGCLFNRVPEMSDDEIREALLAANEEFIEPLEIGEMEDTVLKPKPGWERHPTLDTPQPLTDTTTPWLPKDPAVTITGLDLDGRVPMKGDVKSDNNPHDVLRLAWAVALGHATPHIATLGRDLVVVSGAESGSLDISELTPRRLRSMCASADLTYYHHVEEKKDDEGTSTPRSGMSPRSRRCSCATPSCPTRPSASTGRCWLASLRCPCCARMAPCSAPGGR